MERIFEQPTPEEIEARRKMYDEAEKLGIDLMAYDEENDLPEPIMLSQITQKMDLRGLMAYAKSKGVKVAQLTEKERMSFVISK